MRGLDLHLLQVGEEGLGDQMCLLLLHLQQLIQLVVLTYAEHSMTHSILRLERLNDRGFDVVSEVYFVYGGLIDLFGLGYSLYFGN